MYGEITQETIDLKHGIKLDLLAPEGKITVFDIAEFLSNALHHFRALKAQGVATYSDAFLRPAFPKRRSHDPLQPATAHSRSLARSRGGRLHPSQLAGGR